MNNISITRPLPQMHDWHASVGAGWDPESDDDPPYSYGDLALPVTDNQPIFQSLIDAILDSPDAILLNPLSDIAEPEIFPEVEHPITENMVFVNPTLQDETGLYPKAALWQSGWENAEPYIFVREQVYERLEKAVSTLRQYDSSLSLCITDGWRSDAQQRELFHSFYVEGYVEGEPRYVAVPSAEDRFAAPHPAGGAVDVMLGINEQAYWIGSPLDWMDVQAHTDYFEEGDLFFLRDMRRIFTNLLCSVGFASIDAEWWHVEYGTRRWAGKKNTAPLYGNATIDVSLFDDITPVMPVHGSRRAAIF